MRCKDTNNKRNNNNFNFKDYEKGLFKRTF